MIQENLQPSKKMINFDIDQARLKEVYPGKSPNHAYTIIGSFLKKNNFEHVQGSGYISKDLLLEADVTLLVNELIYKNLRLADCLKAITSTNVTWQSDYMNDVTRLAKVLRAKKVKSKSVNKKQQKGSNGFSV